MGASSPAEARGHGWLPDHEERPGVGLRPLTQADAVAWLVEMWERLQAIHDAEHPPPTSAQPER